VAAGFASAPKGLAMSPSAAIATSRSTNLRANDAPAASANSVTPEAYPFALVTTPTGFAAGGLQFAAAATAPTRTALLERLAEIVALLVADALVAGVALEPPLAPDALDLGDYAAEGLQPEVVYVGPAPLSDASIAIARALHDDGVSAAELARRMGVPRSVISRLTDPLYFGHTTRTLRGVAAALDRTLTIALTQRAG
jgi:hypothetical protein